MANGGDRSMNTGVISLWGFSQQSLYYWVLILSLLYMSLLDYISLYLNNPKTMGIQSGLQLVVSMRKIERWSQRTKYSECM